jgi:hypothetical protein
LRSLWLRKVFTVPLLLAHLRFCNLPVHSLKFSFYLQGAAAAAAHEVSSNEDSSSDRRGFPDPCDQLARSGGGQAVASIGSQSSACECDLPICECAFQHTLDDALHLAVQHNHALLALRSAILQSQAQEVTANLRPNPVLAWDAQFLPSFNPINLAATIWITMRNSMLALAIFLSAAKSGSIACKLPRMQPPLFARRFPIPNGS